MFTATTSQEKIDEARQNMEQLSGELIELILSQPPQELIAYFSSQFLMALQLPLHEQKEAFNEISFILEYIHAALSSSTTTSIENIDEAVCAQIEQKAKELKSSTIIYCITTTSHTQNGVFGDKTSAVEFLAKTQWVIMRGHRYQALEEEFYTYVLTPHDETLNEIYKIGAKGIAKGIQEITNARRIGYQKAFELIKESQNSANKFHDQSSDDEKTSLRKWSEKYPQEAEIYRSAIDDIFCEGTCDAKKHSALPDVLLNDLSFERGEETNFLAEGELKATPMRTLPVRKKPLIKNNGRHLALDPCFARDAGYRAILWNLLQKKPEYKLDLEIAQKNMTENAFEDIFSSQLQGASIYKEIYYKDPKTNKWVENDVLVILDDVLIQIEAKGGAAATIASPALDFDRHVRSIQDLVIKAYRQCERFINYLNSDTTVPIFKLENGKYTEITKITFTNYRIVLPIGLTIESFSPFSAMCKTLPEISPILNRYPFLSLSIDDLFILKRLFPTTGQLMHYFEVRQAVAGIKEGELYDEIDHAGAYITHNRIDIEIQEQLNTGVNTIYLDGFCDAIDTYFGDPDWESKSPPSQEVPSEVTKLLAKLDKTRSDGWLKIDSLIRNFNQQGRNKLDDLLKNTFQNLSRKDHSYFAFSAAPTLFVWLQRIGIPVDTEILKRKAQSTAISVYSKKVYPVIIFVTPQGTYNRVKHVHIDVPSQGTPEYTNLSKEVEHIKNRKISTTNIKRHPKDNRRKKIGVNDPCWCGSGKKLKKCHGRESR